MSSNDRETEGALGVSLLDQRSCRSPNRLSNKSLQFGKHSGSAARQPATPRSPPSPSTILPPHRQYSWDIRLEWDPAKEVAETSLPE